MKFSAQCSKWGDSSNDIQAGLHHCAVNIAHSLDKTAPRTASSSAVRLKRPLPRSLSDAAALRTRAQKVEGGWLINGAKQFIKPDVRSAKAFLAVQRVGSNGTVSARAVGVSGEAVRKAVRGGVFEGGSRLLSAKASAGPGGTGAQGARDYHGGLPSTCRQP